LQGYTTLTAGGSKESCVKLRGVLGGVSGNGIAMAASSTERGAAALDAAPYW